MKIKTLKSVFFLLLLVTVALFAVSSCGKNTPSGSDTLTDSAVDDSSDSSVSDTQGAGMTHEATYGENGEQNGQKVYSSNGNIKSEEIWDKLGRVSDITMYNDDGTEDAKQHVSYSGDGETPIAYETVKYHYSEDNGELENYNVSYFNEKMQKTDETCYNADGSLINMCKYEYDDVGNVTCERYYGENYDLQRITESEYNVDDRLVKEIYKDGLGEVLSMTGYEYNADGNVSKQLEYDADGTVRSYCLYVYSSVEGEAPEEQIYVRGEDGEYVRFN